MFELIPLVADAVAIPPPTGANINLNQLLDMLSGAGGVGLIAYGLFSRAMKRWEEMQTLISKALNDVAEIKANREKCRPAHDNAIMEMEDDIKKIEDRLISIESAMRNNNNQQPPTGAAQTIIREATKWIN